MWKKKKEPETVQPSILLNIVVDGRVIETFQVSTPRLAALFLSNPTFTEAEM